MFYLQQARQCSHQHGQRNSWELEGELPHNEEKQGQDVISSRPNKPQASCLFTEERENGHTAKAAWKKKNGHTLYKVVPERSQCELNGLRILDGQRDILTGYRSKSSQVEKTNKKKNLFPHTASRETLLPTPHSCQWVSESVAQQPVTSDWIADNNAATAKLVKRLDSDFNPTQLLQHTNQRRFLALTTFTRARLPNSNSERMWTGNKMEETFNLARCKNTIKTKIENKSVQRGSFTQTRTSEHRHMIPDTWRGHRDNGNE